MPFVVTLAASFIITVCVWILMLMPYVWVIVRHECRKREKLTQEGA